MSAIPSWLGATAGQPAQAGQANQFLGAHPATYLYAAALQVQANTAGSGSQGTSTQWLAQSFTTAAAQTAVGRVVLQLAVTGSPSPGTVSIYASSGGLPTGSPLVSTALPKEFVGGSAAAVSIPLPLTVTASTQYWIVVSEVGSAGNLFSWSQNNVGSGAATSTNGTSWTAAAYGLMYQVYDQSASGLLTHTWEDAGARWTSLGYNGTSQLTALKEYTAAQSSGYLQSARALTYSGSLLTGIA